MNGAHDMGGRLGFGVVETEAHEPTFHSKWEGRIYGLAGALGGFDLWNLDEDRHACENHHPHTYISSSYYQIWLMMLEKMLVEKGVVTPSELTTGKSRNGKNVSPRLRANEVMAAQIAPGSYDRSTSTQAAFSIGQRVRVKNMMTPHHTRLPGYLRGVEGVIEHVHGHHVYPDSHAMGGGEDPRWLYGVRFTSMAVWGRDRRDTVHADLWEPYLERA